MDEVKVSETIKKLANGKFALFTKDGAKLLGTHDSRADAEKQEVAINISKAGESSTGLSKDVASGAVEMCEGGRYMLGEDSGDVARLTDAQLKKMRDTFTTKRNEKRAAQQALAPEQQYGSPEGSQLSDDCWYYQRLLSQIECEMQDRLLPLD